MMSAMRPKDAPERLLVELLCGTSTRRQGVAEQMADLATLVDVTRLVALLKRLRMLVLIGGRLLSLDLPGMPDIERELKEHGAPARAWGVVTEFTTLDLLDHLESAGIRALPLKGSTLARRLYRDVGARTSIDLDILVAPDDLAQAVTTLEKQGWHWLRGVTRPGRLPLLHETLIHPTLPRVELHWRVHWYEQSFAADALARAEAPAPDAPLEMQPLDGLIALMLFYARDGFAGLRFPADVAAWWDLMCRDVAGSAPVELVGDRYPALVAPVSVASILLAKLVGVPTEQPPEVPFRWGVAAGLASPFLQGGRLQAEANAGLTDLLLAPPAAAGEAIRRVIRNAPTDPSRRDLAVPPPWKASLGHVLRVGRRWVLALAPALVRGIPWAARAPDCVPLSRSSQSARRPAERPTAPPPTRSS